MSLVAANVLQDICSHNWIKERCLKQSKNILDPIYLLESALLKPQTLLRIICYPENHHLRNINEQVTSTKDVIRHILQCLDIWTLRESLLELRLMIEIQESKDCHYVSKFQHSKRKKITAQLYQFITFRIIL